MKKDFMKRFQVVGLSLAVLLTAVPAASVAVLADTEGTSEVIAEEFVLEEAEDVVQDEIENEVLILTDETVEYVPEEEVTEVFDGEEGFVEEEISENFSDDVTYMKNGLLTIVTVDGEKPSKYLSAAYVLEQYDLASDSFVVVDQFTGLNTAPRVYGYNPADYGLTENTLYRIVENQADDGYLMAETDTYFIVSSDENATELAYDNRMTIENIDTESIEIQMIDPNQNSRITIENYKMRRDEVETENESGTGLGAPAENAAETEVQTVETEVQAAEAEVQTAETKVSEDNTIAAAAVRQNAKNQTAGNQGRSTAGVITAEFDSLQTMEETTINNEAVALEEAIEAEYEAVPEATEEKVTKVVVEDEYESDQKVQTLSAVNVKAQSLTETENRSSSLMLAAVYGCILLAIAAVFSFVVKRVRA